jgi:uncharacterized protein YoxC
MNNNPFEPVTTDPNDGNPPLTDGAADDFTADSGGDSNNTARAPLSIDGINSNYDTDAATTILKIDENGDSTVGSAASSNDILTDDHAGDFLNDSLPAEESESSSATLGSDSPEPVKDEVPTPADTTPSTDTKPTKTVKISLLTIILLILAIAGIAGAVWFYMQNNKNADALADSEAKVQRLQDELSATATSENTTAGQYDGLNDKIKEGEATVESLTKDKADLTKKNEELTKKVTDLTTQNTELQKQATNISSLTTRLDKVLPLLETAFGSQQQQ